MSEFGRIKALVLILIVGITFPQLISTVQASTASGNGFIQASGTHILDPSGNMITLRGVNYYGYECDNMNNELHTEADYRRFASLGFNVVRLPIGWEWLEPQPGSFDQSYLSIVNRDIQWAKKYGLYVIVDMHQYLWASRFPDPTDGSHGCGAPGWTVAQYPATDSGRFHALANFWVNETLQDHYADLWKEIATVYANEPTIAGYDIMNEPPDPAAYSWVVPGLDYSFVVRFYLKVIGSIRSVDTNHAIFLELTSENVLPSGFYLTPSRIRRDNIIWSPHFYPAAFEPHYSGDIGPLRDQLELYHQQIVHEYGSAMWIGEYGAFMNDDTYLTWLHDAVGLFNEYGVGSAWWPYHGGPGQQIPAPVLGR